MHDNHREHLKDRFLAEGLDNFEAHNALELLLFYAIPRRDVNELAHTLINTFGSLSGVFDAPISKLTEIKGLGDHAATLLKLIPAISKSYFSEHSSLPKKLSSIDEIGKYLVTKYVGILVETVFLLLLDAKGGLLDCITLHVGSVNSAAITVRRIVELALEKRSSGVVLAHNHPGGIPIPSSDDISTTVRVAQSLSLVDIRFIAHIVVAGENFTNISPTGLNDAVKITEHIIKKEKP